MTKGLAITDPNFTDRLSFNKWAVRQVGQCCQDVEAGAPPYGTMMATTKRIKRVGEAHSHLPAVVRVPLSAAIGEDIGGGRG